MRSRVAIGVCLIASLVPTALWAETITNLGQLAKRQVRLTQPLRAELVGDYASTILAETHARGPVLVRTQLVEPLSEDCGRVQARITVRNTPKVDGSIGDFWMDFQFDICRDGNPPPPGVRGRPR